MNGDLDFDLDAVLDVGAQRPADLHAGMTVAESPTVLRVVSPTNLPGVVQVNADDPAAGAVRIVPEAPWRGWRAFASDGDSWAVIFDGVLTTRERDALRIWAADFGVAW